MVGRNWKFDIQNQTLRIVVLVLAGGLTFGFGTTSISGLLDRVRDDFQLGTAGEQLVVGILVLACFVGAAVAGPVSARWGRRRAIMLATGLGGLGYVLILAHLGLTGLLVGRTLAGLCIGLLSMVVPMYAAEATPARYRGAVVSMFQLAITLGILVAYGVALAFAASVPWPLILAAGIIPAAIGLAVILSLPESPHWLVAKGHHLRAQQAAHRLGLSGEWEAPVPDAAVASGGQLAVLRRGSTMAVLALCSVLFVLQNLSGIDGILYYAPRIFQELGFSAGTAALAATFGLGLINALGSILAIALVDRLGRRPLLIFGSAAMAVGLAVVVAASQFGWPWFGLVGLGVFIAAFALSLGPLPYVLMSELFPLAIREPSIAVASAISWLFNALIAFTFLSMVSAIGLSGSIGLFLAVCVCSLVVCLLYAPETRGVRLEEIETAVLAGKPLRRLGE